MPLAIPRLSNASAPFTKRVCLHTPSKRHLFAVACTLAVAYMYVSISHLARPWPRNRIAHNTSVARRRAAAVRARPATAAGSVAPAEAGWPRGSVVSWREFTGSVRDTHEPALPALHTSSFLDFANVAVAEGTLLLYGASAADAAFVRDVLRGTLPRYQYFINGRVDSFPPVRIATRNHTLPACARVWDCTAVFLSLWHPDNQYHLMNDNIVPLLVNLQSNPACAYTARGGFVCTPALTLFLLGDDADRNSRAVSSARLLLDLLAPSRIPAITLFNTQRETHCVKRLTWGRGRLGFAVPLDRSVARALRVLREYARVPTATVQGRANVSALLVSRPHGAPRSITDMGPVARACLATGVQCRPCCDFGARGLGAAGARLQTLVAELAGADILLGAHGAGMSLVLFARRGAITINVMPEDEGTWNVIFPRMAVANQGHSVIAFVPSTAHGMHVSHASACGLLQCARALLAGAAQTPAPCLLPHVSVLSHRDVTERDKGEVELYRHHGFGSTPPRRVFGSP